MFSAAELIETLEARYRRRYPLHAERPFGEFPPTWRQWFLSMEARADAVTGAPAEDFVVLFAKRPLRRPPKAPMEIGRLQALWRLLHRQQWEAAPREERGLRRFAAAMSILAHVCFVILLFWISIISIHLPTKKDDEAGEAVQVEFIGQGTPEDTGGGPAQGEDETQPPASAATAASAQTASPQTALTPSESPDETSTESATASQPPPTASTEPPPSDPQAQEPPQPAPEPAAQPLAVTEPRTPAEQEPEFALPPPQPRTAPSASRTLTAPELSAPSDVEMLEPRPPVRALERRETVARTPTTPDLRERPNEIEMLEPLPDVQARKPTPRVPSATVRTPDLRNAPSEIAMREPAAPAPAASVPVPSVSKPATASSQPAASSSRPGAAQATPAPRPANANGGRPAATPGTRPAASAGTGPAPQARPGGLPSPKRGDDWDDALRNRPGNSTAGRNNGPGVFNSDGSVRLPSGQGKVGGGLPPGTITEDFEKIDRMGTWLKRPPVDYTPGRLERFFVPSETLLEEWVRRNIREVFVPIPGTSKRVVCKISLLQAGGGCTIDDPNLQDQEAEARKPPNVPFKPDLQQDQGSLRKP